MVADLMLLLAALAFTTVIMLLPRRQSYSSPTGSHRATSDVTTNKESKVEIRHLAEKHKGRFRDC